MGKYQLDSKGKAAVAKYHEKTSRPNSIKSSNLKNCVRSIWKRNNNKTINRLYLNIGRVTSFYVFYLATHFVIIQLIIKYCHSSVSFSFIFITEC